jgi:hypothetical protein
MYLYVLPNGRSDGARLLIEGEGYPKIPHKECAVYRTAYRECDKKDFDSGHLRPSLRFRFESNSTPRVGVAPYRQGPEYVN